MAASVCAEGCDDDKDEACRTAVLLHATRLCNNISLTMYVQLTYGNNKNNKKIGSYRNIGTKKHWNKSSQWWTAVLA